MKKLAGFVLAVGVLMDVMLLGFMWGAPAVDVRTMMLHGGAVVLGLLPLVVAIVTERMVVVSVLVCGLLLAGVNARAQQPQDTKQTEENRRIGLTLGYPASGSSSGVVGLIWEKSDRLAFRPEFSISARFAGESVSSGATDSWALGATLTMLCYVSRREGLSTYVGPRFSYSWASSGGGGTNTRNAGYGAGVNAGVQYRLTKKISVYGEAGLGYLFTRSAYTGTTFAQNMTSHNINSRSSLGLNLYW